MPRRNSSECRFFCSGKVSAGHAPTSSTELARTSMDCPLPCDATTSPTTEIAAPVVSSDTVPYEAMPAGAITCIPLRLEPSLSSTKEKAF